MIEFAFAAPLLLALLMGGLEITNLAMAHMRLSQIAMTVADNAGRVREGIDEADIYEVFAGANVIGEPIDFEAHGRVVLSSLEHNGHHDDDEGQTVVWQRCWGNLDVGSSYADQGDGRNDASLANGMGASGRRIFAAENTAVMFVEVTYDYQPLVIGEIVNPGRIRYESAFNVRSRENNAITNVQGLAVESC